MDSISGEKDVGWKNPSAKEIDALLRESKVIAIVGLSSEVSRPSYGVASYLKKQGYTIVPVNPKESTILGERSYPDLRSIHFPVDIVDVFRRSEAALLITEDAIAIGAKAVWLQESIVSVPAYLLAKEAGLLMIMDRCIFKEHSRMISR